MTSPVRSPPLPSPPLPPSNALFFAAVDDSDVLLGSFTCAVLSGVIVQGKMYVVRGVTGARVLFHSNIMTIVTTRELRMRDVESVEKIQRVGVLAAIEIKARDGSRETFCSFLFKENAYRCLKQAMIEDGGGARVVDRVATATATATATEAEISAAAEEASSSTPPPLLTRRNSAPQLFGEEGRPPSSVALRDGGGERVYAKTFPRTSASALFHAMFDERGATFAKHLRTNCGAVNVSSSPLIDIPTRRPRARASERVMTYNVTFPASCVVTDTQRYDEERDGDGRAFVMRSIAATRGVPYADAFIVETRVIVSDTAANERDDEDDDEDDGDVNGGGRGCDVDVRCDVEWRKSANAVVKSLVEGNARERVKKSFRAFLEQVEVDAGRETGVVDRGRGSVWSPRRNRRSPSLGSVRFDPSRPPPRAAPPRVASAPGTAAASTPPRSDESATIPTTWWSRWRRARERERERVGSGSLAPVAAAACFALALTLAPLSLYRAVFALVFVVVLAAKSVRGAGGGGVGDRDRAAPGFLESAVASASDADAPATRRAVRDALRRAAKDDALLDALCEELNRTSAEQTRR